eukprot:3420162-Karenia_brevis.AAC.1
MSPQSDGEADAAGGHADPDTTAGAGEASSVAAPMALEPPADANPAETADAPDLPATVEPEATAETEATDSVSGAGGAGGAVDLRSHTPWRQHFNDM